MQTKSCCPQPSPPLSLSLFLLLPLFLSRLPTRVNCHLCLYFCCLPTDLRLCLWRLLLGSLAPWQCCRCRLLAVVTLLLLLLLPCLLLCLLFILLGHSVSCGAEELRSWETEELCVRYNAAVSEPDSISISFCVGAKKFDLPAAIL